MIDTILPNNVLDLRTIMLVNMTPHPINYLAHTLSKCENNLPRVSSTETKIQSSPFPLYSVTFSTPENIPAQIPNTFYIVSAIFAQAMKNVSPERNDFIVPHVVRDNDGKIVGCDGFSRI